jgi:hypothetical protein
LKRDDRLYLGLKVGAGERVVAGVVDRPIDYKIGLVVAFIGIGADEPRP